jgi:hypothetical protein
LSDQAYRKATGLPIYTGAELNSWKHAISITSLAMPLFCDSRKEPYNIWTLEEKVAWVDQSGAEEAWFEEEEQAIAKRWNGKPPGHAD